MECTWHAQQTTFQSVSCKWLFAISTIEPLVTGGGGDGAAISIDKEMYHGSSRQCATFNSPVLSGEDMFTVAGIEVHR